MDGALVGDFEQALARRLVHVAGDFDFALDAVDPAVPGFAVLAVLGVDLFVLERHGDAIDGQTLALSVHAHGHACARPQPGEKQVVRRGAGVVAAVPRRLVGGERVFAAHRYGLGEPPLARLRDDDGAGLDGGCGRPPVVRRPVHVAGRPRGDDLGHVHRVRAAAQQVVGVIEGEEALGVLGRRENMRGVVDADRLVPGPVEDEQRLAQVADGGTHVVRRGIVQEVLLDAERPAAEGHLGLPLGLDLG